MQGIARGQKYVHIVPQNLPDDDDDIDNPIVLRVQDISEDNYYEITFWVSIFFRFQQYGIDAPTGCSAGPLVDRKILH